MKLKDWRDLIGLSTPDWEVLELVENITAATVLFTVTIFTVKACSTGLNLVGNFTAWDIISTCFQMSFGISILFLVMMVYRILRYIWNEKQRGTRKSQSLDELNSETSFSRKYLIFQGLQSILVLCLKYKLSALMVTKLYSFLMSWKIFKKVVRMLTPRYSNKNKSNIGDSSQRRRSKRYRIRRPRTAAEVRSAISSTGLTEWDRQQLRLIDHFSRERFKGKSQIWNNSGDTTDSDLENLNNNGDICFRPSPPRKASGNKGCHDPGSESFFQFQFRSESSRFFTKHCYALDVPFKSPSLHSDSTNTNSSGGSPCKFERGHFVQKNYSTACQVPFMRSSSNFTNVRSGTAPKTCIKKESLLNSRKLEGSQEPSLHRSRVAEHNNYSVLSSWT